MRSANKEIFDKNTDPRRKASLRRQIELFRNRYLSNTRALQSSVLANALAFVLVICSAFELYALAAEVLRFLGVVLAITVGFVFAEIFRSHQTLDEDVQAAIASIDEPRSSADPPSPGD